MAPRSPKSKSNTEYGDFQTPAALARVATRVLVEMGVRPRSIIEPTCGKGSFVSAAELSFPEATSIVGVEINQVHLDAAKRSVSGDRVAFMQGDFFSIVSGSGDPWLIIGNPPWVTSAALGAIASDNLPEKSNFHDRTGIEAITGKSNFDISEWMLLRYLDWLAGRDGTIAVLCKTAVSRKILFHCWKKGLPLHSARMHKIDALSDFSAAVDACFFVLELRNGSKESRCEIFNSLAARTPSSALGYVDGHIVTDINAYKIHQGLLSRERQHYVWRSGIKHDCSKVMEMKPANGGYVNGFDEWHDLERTYLFPMLKSSDIGNGRVHCRRFMLVTQQAVGESTRPIQYKAPKTWDYLQKHALLLDKRGSVIYKNKPSYSLFGVGPYSFAPWKVAISGFYKALKFIKVGSVDARPVVFDDTVNFLPCWSENEADFIAMLLASGPAQEFLGSMVHWDEKRPITVDILKRLSIIKLAAVLGRAEDYARFVARAQLPSLDSNNHSDSLPGQIAAE